MGLGSVDSGGGIVWPSDGIVDRQAGRTSGFSNLGIVMDLPWVTLDKSLPSLGLSLQPVSALVSCKAVFELGGSIQLPLAMVHNGHKRAGNLFCSEVCRLTEEESYEKEHKVVSYPRAHYKMATE